VARMQRLVVSNNTEAKLMNINRYEDNAATPAGDRRSLPQFLPMVQMERLADAQKRAPGTEAAKRATGFNIGPCLVATPHHVVYGTDTAPESNVDYGMIVSVGVKADSQKFLGYTKDTQDVAKHERNAEGSGDGDWTVVKTKLCPGKAFGWYKPSTQSVEQLIKAKAQVFVVSFPGDRAVGELEVGHGNITGSSSDTRVVEYNSSTAPGSSGGAVFVMENGEMRLVGMHIGGQHEANGNYTYKTHTKSLTNRFVPVAEFMNAPRVKAALSQDEQENGSLNKAAPFFKAAPKAPKSTSTGQMSV
ncbi:MAG: serine protease, partial [Proteobacteria bacterium]